MPLIVLCGTPLSGKTTFSKNLFEFLTKNNETSSDKNIKLISDEDKLLEQQQDPNEIYKNSSKEKQLRSWLKSEVQRYLSSPDTLVILDSLNYIKGYRYELYCLSKQFKTTYLLIELLSNMDLDQQFLLNNHSNNPKRQYCKEIFLELIQRYEKPSETNRWEEPLIKIPFRSDPSQIPFEEILNAIYKRNVLKPNRSTELITTTTDNFLNELDNQTQEVLKQIQQSQQLNQLKNIKIQNTNVMVNLNRKIPIIELNKLRRQFINYSRLNPPPTNDKEKIITLFVQFLNNSTNIQD